MTPLGKRFNIESRKSMIHIFALLVVVLILIMLFIYDGKLDREQ